MEEIIIGPGIGVMHGLVNAGFVAGSDGVLIIDTMYSPADGREIEAFARRHSTAPFRAVLNTHHHADHTFGNQVFATQVIASEECRRRMVDNLRGAWSHPELQGLRQSLGDRLDGLQITVPSITFAQGLSLFVGQIGGQAGGQGRVDFRVRGGHTPGSSTVFLPEQGVMFSGDLFFVGRYPFVRHADTLAWVDALRRIKEVAPATLVPGHGPVCDTKAMAREADRMIEYFLATRGTAEAMLSEGLTRDEIVARAPEFPRAAAEGYERLHAANVGYIVDEVTTNNRTALG
jgi:cyclase